MAIGTTTALILGGLAAAGGIGGSLISSNAANQAANTQATAGTEAAKAALEASKYQTDALLKAAQQANSLQELQNLITQQQQQPYQEVGTGALMTIKDLMQPGGYLAETAPQFNFDVSKVATDPGYDFAMKEGQKALERSAAAKGTLMSGATGKALQRYGQDYATGKVNDVYNRQLSTYGTNYNTETANRGNLYNRLAALAGVGQTAVNQMGTSGANAATNIGANTTGTAANIANIGTSAQNAANNYLTNAAAAKASGYVGSGNIWASTLSQLGQLPANYYLSYLAAK